ncbi:MAG: glycosyltransferase family 2 protein, partial [Bacteroidales bacterium]
MNDIMYISILIFWVSLFIVFYTYVGYGILLFLLVKIKEAFISEKKIESILQYPQVTLLIAAYNEEDVVALKISNSKELDYPKDKLKIVWVTDGSTDSTNNLLEKYSYVKVLFKPERMGKTAAINRAVQFIDSPIIVFTDANTILNPSAITEIVKAFANPQVGCVAGEKRILYRGEDRAAASGEGLYWKYESYLKSLDSRLHSAVGAAGELFAIRGELFEEIAPDTLLDDFVISMKIAAKGYKIEYCKEAYAQESGSLTMVDEKKRKVRIAAGGIQSIYRLSYLMNIFKYPILSFQFISHRVLRWTITPILLFALLPLNLVIVLYHESKVFYYLLALQLIFYVLALIGKVIEDKKI